MDTSNVVVVTSPSGMLFWEFMNSPLALPTFIGFILFVIVVIHSNKLMWKLNRNMRIPLSSSWINYFSTAFGVLSVVILFKLML